MFYSGEGEGLIYMVIVGVNTNECGTTLTEEFI